MDLAVNVGAVPDGVAAHVLDSNLRASRVVAKSELHVERARIEPLQELVLCPIRDIEDPEGKA
jgi:hypothetical protein